ncbi:efflux RND transporter periplasmic adaptor subunit [Pelagicoccus mobilis]|uniref:Efflux RND transporter periplasmic adaptor subunit n=1 Tax=Pelagicoccus mobilis TaxID=415221 RepID=A0A934S025_9BACT|nr:efflux RND transporter periplasmic adaptor subunit [Pelagicoccus mobilis]MBK1878700.1 efflux RND transporter periplasmic adaptor subunit [Pelagicoccus mobilis]
MKRFLTIVILIAAAGGSYFYLKPNSDASEAEAVPKYQFSKIERRSVQNLVSATGTLAARDVVEISTQVSGKLLDVKADFNDEIEEGDLIAVIDPAVLDSQVAIAKANLIKSEAQLLKAKNNYNRFKPVHEKGHLSDNDFQPYQIALQTAEADVLSSEANLSRAERNRGYAEIRSPISGIVIDRTIEPGQTVAASFNAPKLFTVAADLSDMEILAEVDESDIGQIKVGQTVRFTVAAYIDRQFEGVVEEIRLLPRVVQNVVNYTVVIGAQNRRGSLMPGMTASLDFVVAEVDDVLSVPTAALNLRPNEEMTAFMQERRERMMAERGGEGGGRRPGGGEGGGRGQGGGDGPRMRPDGGGPGGGFGGPGGGGGGGRRRGVSMLWYLDDSESLAVLPVRAGVSDGAFTEVLPVRDMEIPEDLEFISRLSNPSSSSSSSQSQRGGPGGGGLRRLGF